MKLAGNIVLSLYWCFANILQFFAPLWLKKRALSGKEDFNRQSERFGLTQIVRPISPLVWIHAASVGETNAVFPLCVKLVEGGNNVLLTTVTLTSAKIAEEKIKLTHGIIHQFSPLDMPKYVTSFLDYWKPQLAIFAESEIWPITIGELQARNIPKIIVNGRMSDKSIKKWRLLRWLTPTLFSQFDQIHVRGEEDLLRFQMLGGQKIFISGNLKYDTPTLKFDPTKLSALQKATHNRPVFLAASTHDGEEAIIGNVHKKLLEKHPDLLTIIVPRHPHRGPIIQKISTISELTIELRSMSSEPSSACDIYVADSLGELGLFYSLATFAFIGGSLSDNGGHNPIEACKLKCAVIHGSNISSFRDVYAVLAAGNVSTQIENESELFNAVDSFLSDPLTTKRLANEGFNILDGLDGALKKSLQTMKPLLPKQGHLEIIETIEKSA